MQIQEVLSTFQKTPHLRSLLLDGPASSGKTMAIDQFKATSKLPYGYVSLAGAETAKDIRDRMTMAILLTAGMNNTTSNPLLDRAETRPIFWQNSPQSLQILKITEQLRGCLLVIDDISLRAMSLEIDVVMSTLRQFRAILDAKFIYIVSSKRCSMNTTLRDGETERRYIREQLCDCEYTINDISDAIHSICQVAFPKFPAAFEYLQTAMNEAKSFNLDVVLRTAHLLKPFQMRFVQYSERASFDLLTATAFFTILFYDAVDAPNYIYSVFTEFFEEFNQLSPTQAEKQEKAILRSLSPEKREIIQKFSDFMANARLRHFDTQEAAEWANQAPAFVCILTSIQSGFIDKSLLSLAFDEMNFQLSSDSEDDFFNFPEV
jgi:hypothetical protein